MSAFLHKKALCAATSKIFKDLCDRSGIKCEICNGKTAIVDEQTGIRRGHAWNIVEDEYGRRSHVDVTYGRFVKDKHEFDKCENRKIEDFCILMFFFIFNLLLWIKINIIFYLKISNKFFLNF